MERAAPPPYRPLAEAVQPILLQPADVDDSRAPFRRALRSLLVERGQEAGEAGELAVAEALARRAPRTWTRSPTPT